MTKKIESYLDGEGKKIYVHKCIKQTVTIRNEKNVIIFQKTHSE